MRIARLIVFSIQLFALIMFIYLVCFNIYLEREIKISRDRWKFVEKRFVGE